MYHKRQLCGPGGVRDCTPPASVDHRYVGDGTMSAEGSSQIDYLWTAPSSVPFPRPRSHKVGEVGWGLNSFSDWSAANTGQQIQIGEFRQMVEDRCTHAYQHPWYPGPSDEVAPGSDAALVMNVYKQDGSQSNTGRRQSSQGKQNNRPGSSYSSHSEHSNYSNNNNNNNNRYHGTSSHRYSSTQGIY